MSITTAKVKAKFEALQTKFAGASVTCSYQGDSFTGTRTTLDLSQVANTYGLVNSYQFSIYTTAAALATRIKNNERITISGGDIVGESGEMRVLGKSVDPTGAFVRLDIKELNAA